MRSTMRSAGSRGVKNRCESALKEALRTIIGVRSVRYSWALTDSRVMPVWTVGVTATEEDFMCPTQTTWRRARW